jgi:DNA-binding Lrp family transcriptional regulator
MIKMKELKPIDYKLLFELMKDSHRSDRQIAKALGVSQPTVTRRRGLLEKNYIEGYTIIPKFGQIGFEIAALTFLKSKVEHLAAEEKATQRYLGAGRTRNGLGHCLHITP